MKFFWLFILAIIAFFITACLCKKSVVDQKYVTFTRIAKVGMRFEDVRAMLRKEQLDCSEPVRQNEQAQYLVSVVSFTHEISLATKVKYVTGIGGSGVRTNAVMKIDQNGVVVKID